ncbi:hypothetical protein, partial [Nocardia xishanensis]
VGVIAHPDGPFFLAHFHRSKYFVDGDAISRPSRDLVDFRPCYSYSLSSVSDIDHTLRICWKPVLFPRRRGRIGLLLLVHGESNGAAVMSREACST